MAKKPTWDLTTTINVMGREGTKLVNTGWGSQKANDKLLASAIHYLEEYQGMKDAQSVADFDLAEVGAIIRRQRETIARLESSIGEYREWAHAADSEANRCKDELRRLGAL